MVADPLVRSPYPFYTYFATSPPPGVAPSVPPAEFGVSVRPKEVSELPLRHADVLSGYIPGVSCGGPGGIGRELITVGPILSLRFAAEFSAATDPPSRCPFHIPHRSPSAVSTTSSPPVGAILWLCER